MRLPFLNSRQILAYTETYALLKPELALPSARSLFDAEGQLQDPATRERLRALIEALVEWARRLERGLEPRPAQSPVLTSATRDGR